MTQELKTNLCAVSFIDLLGSSQWIKDNEVSSLKIVHKAYNKALKALDAISFYKKCKPKVKIFSDNIIIAISMNEGRFKAPIMIIEMSALIQSIFLKEKILTRGGITVGGFYCDKIMAWGKALLESYHIENNISKYPRIVIELDDIKQVREKLEQEKLDWILKDTDEKYFVNYLHDSFYNFRLNNNELQQLILRNLEISNHSENIIEKWSWLKDYLGNGI